MSFTRVVCLVILSLLAITLLPSALNYSSAMNPNGICGAVCCPPTCGSTAYLKIYITPSDTSTCVVVQGTCYGNGQEAGLTPGAKYTLGANPPSGYMGGVWNGNSLSCSYCLNPTVTMCDSNGCTTNLYLYVGEQSNNANNFKSSSVPLASTSYGGVIDTEWNMKSGSTGSTAWNPNATSAGHGLNLNVWFSSISCGSYVCGYPEYVYGDTSGESQVGTQDSSLSFPMTVSQNDADNIWLYQDYGTTRGSSGMADISTDQWIVLNGQTTCCNASDLEIMFRFWNNGNPSGCNGNFNIEVGAYKSSSSSMQFCEVQLTSGSCYPKGNCANLIEFFSTQEDALNNNTGVCLSQVIQDAFSQNYGSNADQNSYSLLGVETGLELNTASSMGIQFNYDQITLGYGSATGSPPLLFIGAVG